MKKIYTLVILICSITVTAIGQVSINNDNTPPDQSAMLDVKSTERGLLPPRMTHAQLAAIENPANGLIIYCTDCGNSGAGALAMFINSAWYIFNPSCLVPSIPEAGIHAATANQVTWNWNPVQDATGYKWNTLNNYTGATDMGTSTTKTETGLICGTAYTRYVWAYNACGNSASAPLTQSTLMNPAVSVSVAASANPVCPGTSVTFTATPTNGGTSPAYQWKKNGAMVAGATNSTYSYVPVNNDSIRCQLTSSTACSQNNPAWSNTIVMTVNANPVPVITGSSYVCAGSVNLTYTSDAGMTGYTWTISPGGTIVTTFQNKAIVNWNSTGSQWIAVNYTNSSGCAATNPTPYNITVNPLPVPTLAGDTGSCAGSAGVVYTTEAGKTNYVWTVSSGGTKTAGGTSTSNTMTVTWNLAGAQTVSVNYRSGICMAATPTVLNVTVHTPAVVSVIIGVSQNPVNAGQSATFTAIPVNGGSSPVFQWFVNGSLVAGATNSTYTYTPANGDAITCQLTSNVNCITGNPAVSNTIAMIVNSVPNAPTEGTHTPSPTQIIWNWNTVAGAAGYKWNTVNDTSTAIDMGTATTQTETGLTCNTPYTRYAWAYNACGNSTPVALTQSTSACGTASCAGTPSVSYGGQIYNTVQIGSQCWLKENLNIGTMINGSSDQINNGVIEKYCFNDDPANCAVYGGLYQWNEMMHYLTTAGVQGICPEGWHIPTDAEWTTATTFLGGAGVAGGKMKTTGTIQAGTGLWSDPNYGATNESGFSAVPAGGRSTTGTFSGCGGTGDWWSSSEISTSNAWSRYMYYGLGNVGRSNNIKNNGDSVRCLRDF